MTQEEKAKRYDEALKRAKSFFRRWENVEEANTFLVLEEVKDIFPELKESEDEKIRKALLELFSNVNKKDFRGIPTEKIIDWLERQSKETRWKPSKEEMEEDDVRRRSTIQVLEYARSLDSYNQYGKKDIDKNIAWLEKQVPIDIKKVLIGARKDVASSIITYLDRNTLGMCLSNMECEDLVNAVVDSDWGKVYDYMKKKLEKQGDKPQGKTAIEAIKEEKVDNRNCVKSDDEIKRKFEIGYWICNGGGNPCKVDDIFGNYYELCSIGGYKYNKLVSDVDANYHLWSIEDAKDGDILCYKDEISLFEHDIKNCTEKGTTFGGFVYHCCYDGKRFMIDSLYSLTEQDKIDIHPATKEQRELLFKKMNDAWYEWDDENKILISM